MYPKRVVRIMKQRKETMVTLDLPPATREVKTTASPTAYLEDVRMLSDFSALIETPEPIDPAEGALRLAPKKRFSIRSEVHRIS